MSVCYFCVFVWLCMVVGISGVLGFIYGVWLFELLCVFDVEMYFVVMCFVLLMMVYEMLYKFVDVIDCVMYYYCVDDMVVGIVSGLFCVLGMIVVLCLMKFLVEIVMGVLLMLFICVVDVMFKECCLFVLMVCEMLFMFVYLCNM